MGAEAFIAAAIARAIAPRRPLSVSAWADQHRVLSRKESAFPGRWHTDRVPMLREPMDCLSVRSAVREVVLRFPIQIGKTALAQNLIGYTMDHDPCPIMVALPGEASQAKWIAQKLVPMIEETPAVQRALTSLASRDAANQRTFKDFAGGQLYIEHAGSVQRLKSTSVRKLIVDELDEFATSIGAGDDPIDLLTGRTSAFPANYQRLFIGTPGIRGISRIDALYEASDQRSYQVPCPHCGARQALVWDGLHWNDAATECWYACRECGACIAEHHKTALLAAGEWIPAQPERRTRGYALNCLYYPFGLGPRWLDLVQMWRAAQNDPAKLKTFINDRLAQAWEDPAMRAVRQNVLRDRADPYRLRTAPEGVLAITAGVDTQDNRLAVHITGWGRGLAAWTLDYLELMGDPENDDVWVALTELLNKPIEHAAGAPLRVEAVCIDAGGHRTEAVKNFVRKRLVRRPLVIFGAVPNNAPVLSRGNLVDVNWRGKLDKRGITVHHVGTVGIKHLLYARISTDADKPAESRLVRLSEDLPPEYFAGLVSETYDPRKNRFVKRGGTRNEPLDTWVYSYAATHHPELRLHRLSRAEWDARAARLTAPSAGDASAPDDAAAARVPPANRPRPRGNFATRWK